MKLFLLKRIGEESWDETTGLIVAAPDEEFARRIAHQSRTDDSKPIWLNAGETTCKMIGLARDPDTTGVLLVDFLEA